MVDDSTAGAARRPSFTSRAARPRLRNLRRRVDRPSSASSACSTTSSRLAKPSLPFANKRISRASAFAAGKLIFVFERPRMVAHLRRRRAGPRALFMPAGQINQPSADGPTKAATIFANGKPAPAPSPSLTWISQPTEPRRELEPRPRDTATSPPALNSSHHGRMIVERLGVQLQARRQVVASILHRSPCGGIDSCNAMFDSIIVGGGAVISEATRRRRSQSCGP